MKRPRRPRLKRRPSGHEPKDRLLAIRLPASLERTLDEFCERMRLEIPWVRMTRSDAVRWLLAAQLKQDEERQA